MAYPTLAERCLLQQLMIIKFLVILLKLVRFFISISSGTECAFTIGISQWDATSPTPSAGLSNAAAVLYFCCPRTSLRASGAALNFRSAEIIVVFS